MDELLSQVRGCELCASQLPNAPRPVLQASCTARILIAGQAPGRRVQVSGVPFLDPSGDRLRQWMDVDMSFFYDPARVAILPMGFCYPGTGSSGDLAPRSECAPAWRTRLLAEMPEVRLTLLLGEYAQAWHLRQRAKGSLTATVRAWREYLPQFVPLPHPSPRNNIWFKRNPWFADELLPELRGLVMHAMAAPYVSEPEPAPAATTRSTCKRR